MRYLFLLLFTLVACQSEQKPPANPLIPSDDPNYAVLQKKMFARQKAFLTDNPTGKQSHKYIVHRLMSGESVEIEIELDKNQPYYLLGDCDNHCYDLDLTLSNSNAPAKPLIENKEKDNTPWFEFIPDHNGKYRVGVKMESCTAEECYFGVQILTLPQS